MPRISGSTVAKKLQCACGREFAYQGSFKKHRDGCTAVQATGADVMTGLEKLRAEFMGQISDLRMELEASNRRVTSLENILKKKGSPAGYRPRNAGFTDWASWSPNCFLEGVTALLRRDEQNQVDYVSGSDTLPFMVRVMYFMNGENNLLEPAASKVTNRRGRFGFCNVNTSTQKRRNQTTISLVKRLSGCEFMPTLEDMRAHLIGIGHLKTANSVLENWTYTRGFLVKRCNCLPHQQNLQSFIMKERFVDRLIRFKEREVKTPLDMWKDDFSVLDTIPIEEGQFYGTMLSEAIAIDRLFYNKPTRNLMKEHLNRMTRHDEQNECAHVKAMVERSNDPAMMSDRVRALL